MHYLYSSIPRIILTIKCYKLKKSVIYRVPGQDSSSFKFLTETLSIEKSARRENYFGRSVVPNVYSLKSPMFFVYYYSAVVSIGLFFSWIVRFHTMECIRSYVFDTKVHSVRANNYTLSGLKMFVRGNIIHCTKRA